MNIGKYTYSGFSKEEFIYSRNYLINEITHNIEHNVGNYDQKKKTLTLNYDLYIKYGLTYDEIASLIKYFSYDSYIINNLLIHHQELGQYEIIINNLDRALEKLPSYEGIVYRGIHIDNRYETLDEVLSIFNNEENIGHWDSFISTANGLYDHEARLQFIIKAKDVKYTLDAKLENGHNEFIFPRKTEFKYENYEMLNIKDKEYMFVYITQL